MISQPNGRFGCVRFGILRAMLIERAASRSINGDSNMQVKQDHNPVIICRSCGADYSAKLPNCPYCGTMNLPAAEQAYMNKLENMRSDLEGLGGLAGRQAKKGFRSMRRKLLIAAMLLCLAAALLYGLHLRREKAETQREKAEFLWQRTAFAEMDAYYASGDYESLLQLYYDAQDAGHHVWQYRHSSFCEFLMKIEIAKYSLREYEAGDGDLVCLLRGFFMTDVSVQNKGVGSGIITELCEKLSQRGYLYVKLGWVKGNPQAEYFWKKEVRKA